MGQDINGKVAYITDAGSGIGRATALELAREGVHVGLIAGTESKLEAVAEEAAANGVKTSYAVCDIAKIDDVNQAVEHLKSDLGSADILLNNAGIGLNGN